MSCPDENSTLGKDDCFFCPGGIHWDAHRIGWAVAGGCAALTALITLFSLTMHATHYQQRTAQKQTMRVLLMPAVYAIVSFFSYRYYTSYEYYVLAETAYEAVTLSAFLMLLMELVALGTADKDIKAVMKEKDKRKLPFPFNCFKFRASKPYFMHALTFSVMQYVVIRPVISIVGIICQYYNVLCVGKYSIHYANVYLEAVDFVSISIALYGLIVFYVLCRDELRGRRPLNKFLAIKLIVFFTFYQGFVFSILQTHGTIKGTALWTAANVKNGLSALCTCVEMVFFSIYMGWAYNWTEYTNRNVTPYQRQTGWKTYFQAIWDTVNLTDFFVEIYRALRFFVNFLRGKPETRGYPTRMQQTFMPDSIDHGDKLPMTNVTGQPRQQPTRTSSGNLFNASMDYQRLHNRSNGTPVQSGFSADHRTDHPALEPTYQSYPHQASSNGHYPAQTTNLAHGANPASPAPRPTGNAAVQYHIPAGYGNIGSAQ